MRKLPLVLLLLGACADESVPSAEENRDLEEAGRLLDEAPSELSNVDENMVARDVVERAADAR